MTERDPRTPDERAVEEDFSTPADPDLRGPGNDDYTTPGQPLTGSEHDDEIDEERNARRATPGDPLTRDDADRRGSESLPDADYTTPGDPLRVEGDRAEEVAAEQETARTATPGNPIEER